MRQVLWVGLLLALLVASSTAARPAQPASAALPDFWGMVVRDPGYEWNTNPLYPNAVNQTFINTMLDLLQAAGVEWVRFEFHGTWGAGYGTLNLAQADYFVSAAHARGMKVLALLGTDILRGDAAQVANFDGGTISSDYPPGTAYCVSPDPLGIGCGVNSYMQAWLERALSIADHYQGRIDAYELFNEPNHYAPLVAETSGAQDEMNPLHVARACTKLFRILRTRGDTTPLILGGIHPLTSTESGRTDRQYISAVYSAEPFQVYHSANGRWPIDGVAYHPYPAEMRRYVDDNQFLPLVGPRLDAVLAVIRTYDDSSRLWITEMGTRGDPASPADMQRQAQFLRAAALIFYERRAQLGPWFWFKYEDFPPASEAWGVVHIAYNDQGVYDVNGTVELFKPTFSQYQQLALGLRQRLWLPLVRR